MYVWGGSFLLPGLGGAIASLCALASLQTGLTPPPVSYRSSASLLRAACQDERAVCPRRSRRVPDPGP